MFFLFFFFFLSHFLPSEMPHAANAFICLFPPHKGCVILFYSTLCLWRIQKRYYICMFCLIVKKSYSNVMVNEIWSFVDWVCEDPPQQEVTTWWPPWPTKIPVGFLSRLVYANCFETTNVFCFIFLFFNWNSLVNKQGRSKKNCFQIITVVFRVEI